MVSPGRLAEKIRRLIDEERYLIGDHAAERLDQRGIMEWQAVDSTLAGHPVDERLDASPNPVAEFHGLLPDGTEIKAVWAHLRTSDIAKLVTVHYLD